MSDRPDRNPTLIPDDEPIISKKHCPLCKSLNISGQSLGGIMVWTCQEDKCKNQWQGGLGRTPILPSELYPYDKYVPSIGFGQNPKTGETIEIKRAVDYTQDFRRGALIPEEEGEE